MTTDPYAVDAGYYDLVNDAPDDDIGLWLSFAGRTERPVLEVGTGTGRIAIAMARAGHTVTGTDPSAAMLKHARSKADEAGTTVTFLEGMLDAIPLAAESFGLMVVPADVFLYCADGDAQLAMLTAIERLLHFNGTLALDLPGPAAGLDAETNGMPILAWTGEGPDGQALDVWQVHEDDLAVQTRWLRLSYESTGEDGLVRRRTSEHQLRYLYRFEVEYLLRLVGLAVADVYGDYDLGPLTNSSERMIVIARRIRG